MKIKKTDIKPDHAPVEAAGKVASSALDEIPLDVPAGEPLNPERDAFPEFAYLEANPDVVIAIENGVFASGWDHYDRHGRAEGRSSAVAPPPGASPSLLPVERVVEVPTPPRCSFENIMVSPGGGIFVVGWIDDTSSPMNQISLGFSNGDVVILDKTNIARSRRGDVEAALNAPRPHAYGFWGFIGSGISLAARDCEVSLRLTNGAHQTFTVRASAFDDVQLRDIMLSHLAATNHFGNRHLEAIVSIGDWLGGEIIKFNRSISTRICSAPYVEVFNRRERKLKGSIIVCLYGRPEYLFLQNALFSDLPGIEDYEFIYICNSPELAERLLSEAKIANRVYGLSQTLILLPGNAGFGAANNLAARYARSDRLLIVNPDVFPRDADWAKKHTDIIASLPAQQTALFGVPLYYDDGSLMHGGMFFEIDSQPSVGVSSLTRHDFVRVEHYGKGAPAGTRSFRDARQVPAVTGAFMSIDRPVFERIEGFTEDFVFGHYEDADLCLKALKAGTQTWLHDIGLWHLEGKGSTRLPVHEGGSTINRWLFTKRWGAAIKDQLHGPKPDLERFSRSMPAAGGDAMRASGTENFPMANSLKRMGSARAAT